MLYYMICWEFNGVKNWEVVSEKEYQPFIDGLVENGLDLENDFNFYTFCLDDEA